MTTENEAFLKCMIPGEGPITRKEFDEFRLAMGRLWQAFWTFRHVTNMSEEDWSKEILELVESLGGLDKARERWEEHKKKKRFIFTRQQKRAILEAISLFFVDHDLDHSVGIEEELNWKDMIKMILTALDATQDEIDDNWWENVDV